MDHWWRKAACRDMEDPEVFFEPATAKLAKRICAGCLVINECLSAALTEEGDQGHDRRSTVRGGLTPRERWGLDHPEELAKKRAYDADRVARQRVLTGRR